MKHHRRGIALVEIAVATILLATLLTVSLQFLARGRMQRLASERRAAALQVAGNAMQHLTALSWAELTPEAAAAVALDADATSAIGGGTLKASVAAQTDEGAAKRVMVEVQLPQPGGGEALPLRLTSWVYRPPGT